MQRYARLREDRYGRWVTLPFKPLPALLIACLWLGGCKSEPTSPVAECVHEGAGFCWTDMGFHGEITAIADTPWGLFVGTHGEGLFRLEAGGWTSAGFPGAMVASIAVGADPAQLVVGFRPGSAGSVPSAIVRSRDGGGSWEVADGGWSDLANRRWADLVAILPGEPEVVLWASRSLILRSEDGTESWTAVEGSVEPVLGGWSLRDWAHEDGSSTVYAGAANEFEVTSGAFFLRTEDRGLTWELSSVVGDLEPGQGAGPDAFRSVAHRPGFPGEIVATKSFRDLYSSDGGNTWSIGPREPSANRLVVWPDWSADPIGFGTSSSDFGAGPLEVRGSPDRGRTWQAEAGIPELLLPEVPVVGIDLQGRLLLTVEGGLWRLEPR